MIVQSFAKFIIREHLRNPITGKVLTLGRQTVGMTFNDAVKLMRQEGCKLDRDYIRSLHGYDYFTRGWGEKFHFITDVTFFELLGVKDLSSMDVSSYEQANIIHNLNEPVPLSLYNQFDFILDGGTFDHLFDIRVAFENVVKMLKSGGRIMHIDAASNYIGQAYTLYTPELFYDYYTVNGFKDCRVGMAEMRKMSQWKNWKLYEFDGDKGGRFQSKHLLISLAIAEKDTLSTYYKMPIQSQYQEKVTETPIPPKMGLILIIKLRLKQKGLAWCIERVLNNIAKRLGKREVTGFRYAGRI